jgi:hypothetical protein
MQDLNRRMGRDLVELSQSVKVRVLAKVDFTFELSDRSGTVAEIGRGNDETIVSSY